MTTLLILCAAAVASVALAFIVARAMNLNPRSPRRGNPYPRRAGEGSASRLRDPQHSPLAAPRRDALPEVQEIAWILRAHRWESTAETPELAELSAHMNHGYYQGCKVCCGDVHAIAAVLHHTLTARAEVDAEVSR